MEPAPLPLAGASSSSWPPWLPPLVGGALVFLACWSLFSPTLAYDFLGLDDSILLLHNRSLLQGLNLGEILFTFTHRTEEMFIPITNLSFLLDSELLGLSPRSFHFTNVLLHALNALLIFLLLGAATRSWVKAFLAALLWGVHPLRCESVAWITERKDVLFAFFSLSSLGCYALSRLPRRSAWLIPSLLLFALALLSKPTAVVLPLLLLVADLWPLGRWRGEAGGWGRLLGEKAPFLALSLLLGAATVLLHRGSLVQASLPSRLDHALGSLLVYLKRFLLPETWAIRSFDTTWAEGAGWGWIALPLLAGAGFFLWRERRRRPFLPAGAAWFVLASLPTSGILPSGGQWVSDRFTYLPHMGLAVCLVWGIDSFLRSQATRRGLLLLALASAAVLSSMTARQLPFFRSELAAAERGLARSPLDRVAQRRWGVAMASAGLLAPAERAFRQVLAQKPDDQEALYNLGLLLEETGRLPEALEMLAREVSLAPGDLWARFHLAGVLLKMGRPGEAREGFAALTRLFDHPQDRGTAFLGMGLAWDEAGDRKEAAAAYRQAMALDPGNPDPPYNLALTLWEGGDPGTAAAEAESALRRHPADGGLHLLLGRILRGMGREEEAAAHLREAARLGEGTVEGERPPGEGGGRR